MLWSLAGYVVLLGGSAWLLSGDALSGSPWRYAVALLPVPAAVGIAAAAIVRYRRMDEVLQRMHTTALTVAFVSTVLVAFVWGFLEGVGLPRLGGFGAFGVLVGSYVLTLLWTRSRYR